ncbi:transcription factor BEE 3 [Gossypium hirsutum]|uniref:Transcription factor BEE 3 n=1 Tax=Gossypium hirsutum TaxID=3635 RepID=A0ABM3AYD1_GOSHI|nr:transcription factor BEE 3-like [Gossypium hirsutum]
MKQVSFFFASNSDVQFLINLFINTTNCFLSEGVASKAKKGRQCEQPSQLGHHHLRQKDWSIPFSITRKEILVNQHDCVPSVSQPIFTPGNEFHEETHKRKELDLAWETSFWNSSSPHVYETEINIRNNPGRGKRAKSNGKEEEKPKEVVHVRARRGQATNSHCVAERVRRGKINERLRSLQDIVPGCYRFLSMKLTAASACYDFNSDSDDMETMQRRQKG